MGGRLRRILGGLALLFALGACGPGAALPAATTTWPAPSASPPNPTRAPTPEVPAQQLTLGATPPTVAPRIAGATPAAQGTPPATIAVLGDPPTIATRPLPAPPTATPDLAPLPTPPVPAAPSPVAIPGCEAAATATRPGARPAWHLVPRATPPPGSPVVATPRGAATPAPSMPTPVPLPTPTAIPPPVPAPSPTLGPPRTPEEFRQRVAALVADYEAAGAGVAGVVIAGADGAPLVALDADRIFATASLYKLFILWGVQRAIAAGVIADDTPLTFCPADDDSGEDGYALWDYGDQISVAALRELMITASNNSAAWLLARTIGWETVDRLLAANGFAASRATAGLSTPRELARFLDGLLGQSLDPSLRAGDYATMLALLRAQQVNSYLSPGFPPGADFAHKTGNLPGIVNDAGILFLPAGGTVTIAVLTEGDEEASLALMRELAALIWAYYGG